MDNLGYRNTRATTLTYYPMSYELGTDHPIFGPFLPLLLTKTTEKPPVQSTTTKQTLLAVHISNSMFHDNVGGGVNIELYTGYTNTKY